MLYSISTAVFCVLLLLLVIANFHATVQAERTRKASKQSVERIKRLINEKAKRDFAQNDAITLLEPPSRNPEARRHHDELTVNEGLEDDYLQGDLELAEWQAERLQRQFSKDNGGDSQQTIRGKRKVGREPFYKRWDKRRPISFDLADNIPEGTRHTVRQALALWERETCLRFAEGGPDVDRLEFFDGGGCSSFVGRAGGTQGISIATPGCDFVGIIAHEVGHALGTFHEQARPDQPRHIAVHYNNIPVSRWNNFQPVSDDQAATLGLPYDAGSVMHYGPYGFAADQFRPTISTLDRHWQSTIGQRAGPSFLDIQAINEAYACADHCPGPLPSCLHGGYPHPNHCQHCQCPTGFGGPLCDTVQPSPCGGTIQLSTSEAVIASPRHPAPFPPGLDCFWLLRAPPGGHVHLRLVQEQFFGYTCEDTCDKSFVELKVGPDFRVTGYRFCCSPAPGDVFRSGGSEMVVIHRSGQEQLSDGGIGAAGFSAHVWSDLDWPPVDEFAEMVGKPNVIDVDTFDGEKRAEEKRRTTEEKKTKKKMPTTTTTKEIIMTETTEKALTITTTMETTLIPQEVTTATTILPVETITTATIPREEEKEKSNSSITITVEEVSPTPTPLGPHLLVNCSCQSWSDWSECSQLCGGCGRRKRHRQCVPGPPLCQQEERRMCNQMMCPSNTNFLFNNGEFHLLWKGCCIGLFPRSNSSSSSATLSSSALMAQSAAGGGTMECGPLDTNENAFLRILSSLLSSQDGKRKTANSTAITEQQKQQLLLARRRVGEH